MKATELLELLREFYRDKLAMREQHFRAAQGISDYDVNNTYQYVIAREDVQLNWLRDAVENMDGVVEGDAAQYDPGVAGVPGRMAAGAQRLPEMRVVETDRDAAQAFVEKWRPRVDGLGNARHRGMLRVILGETLEHGRFFEQALAGRRDLLGRRADGAGTGGGVLPRRWIEQ